jgi:hypothetical protein
MKTDIKMALEDGKEKSFSFKATGTTAVRFKTIFGDEIMAEITALWNSVGTDDLNTAAAITEGKKVDDETGTVLRIMENIATSGHMDAVGKLAYVMNRQAEGVQMSDMGMDDYLDWLDQFQPIELLKNAVTFIQLYLGNRETTSSLKKASGPQTES